MITKNSYIAQHPMKTKDSYIAQHSITKNSK